jgi:hypothetical protein
MRSLDCSWFLLVAGLWAQPPSPLGSIVGVVRYVPTGEPARFQVQLCCNKYGGAVASADGAGSYTLRGIPSGTYRLAVTTIHPTGSQYKLEKTVVLAEGQKLTVDFDAPSHGLLTGRVVDEAGDPVPRARVSVLDKVYNGGALRYRPIYRAETDELGVYRADGLPTGRSLVVRADASLAGGESPADSFFPGTTYVDAAREIVLAPGERRGGVELRRIKKPSHCLDGVAEGGPGFEFLSLEITRAGVVGDFVDMLKNNLPATGGPLQKFVICGLHNGRYQIGAVTADMQSRPSKIQSSEGTAVIVGEDLHGLRLRPRFPVTISGETVWDGEAPVQASDVKVLIHMEGTLRAGGFVPAEPAVPEIFSVSINLAREDYLIDRVEVVHGRGAYVKDVTWDGDHLPNQIVNFGDERASGHIRILVAGDGASVSFHVADKDGSPVSRAYVAMIPASATNEAEMSAVMVFGQTDENGIYSASAVPPGRYRVLAMNDSIGGATELVTWGNTTDRGANLVSKLWAARFRGQQVEIGASSNVQLKLEPRSLQ